MERRATLDSQHRFNVGLLAVAILAGLALARLPLRPLVTLVGGTSIVLVTLIEPLAGLALTLIAAPLAAYLNYMMGAVLRPLDIGQVMLLLTFGAWFLRGLARREIRLPVVPLIWPLVIFVGWAAISLLWAPSVENAALEVVKWAEIILIMLMVTEAAGKPRLGWVIAGVLVSGIFQAALGIWQHSLRGIGPETFKIGERLYRAYGSFEQPNPYAGYIGLIWPVATGLLIAQISNLHAERPISNLVLSLASCLLPPALCASCFLPLASCLSWRSCSPGRVERGWARWRPSR